MAIDEYNICDKLRCMVLEKILKAIVIATVLRRKNHDEMQKSARQVEPTSHLLEKCDAFQSNPLCVMSNL